jgi:hypothetical protein
LLPAYANRLSYSIDLSSRSHDALAQNVSSLSVAEVVAMIKKTPPHVQNIRPAQGSLADALRLIPDDPNFDLVQWNADWQTVEDELRVLTQADADTEGRS